MKRNAPVWGIITQEYTTQKGGTRNLYTVTYERERVSTLLSLRQLKLLASFLRKRLRIFEGKEESK